MSETPIQLSTGRKATLALVTCLLLLGALELVLRVSGMEFFESNQLFPLNRDISFTQIYDKDSELFWRLKPSITAESESFSDLSYRINSAGFRGPEWSELTGDKLVLAMGNSCTFGWAVPYDSIYTARLNTGADYRVLNCGTPGYSSYQGKTLLKKALELYQPKVVTLMFGWNDHWPAGSGIADKDQEPLPQWALDFQNALAELKTYQALRKLALSVSQSDSDNDPGAAFSRVTGARRVGLTDFARNLEEMVSLISATGAKPILLVPPIASLSVYLPGVGSSPFHDLHAEYQATVRRVATRTDCQILDLQPLFDQRSDLFDYPVEDPVHFNAQGHFVVFSALLSQIR